MIHVEYFTTATARLSLKKHSTGDSFRIAMPDQERWTEHHSPAFMREA
jgi:hypothetical protein